MRLFFENHQESQGYDPKVFKDSSQHIFKRLKLKVPNGEDEEILFGKKTAFAIKDLLEWREGFFRQVGVCEGHINTLLMTDLERKLAIKAWQQRVPRIITTSRSSRTRQSRHESSSGQAADAHNIPFASATRIWNEADR